MKCKWIVESQETVRAWVFFASCAWVALDLIFLFVHPMDGMLRDIAVHVITAFATCPWIKEDE